MWVQERNGKYRYFERYTGPITGKQKRVSVTLTSNSRQTLKQATMMLQEKIEKLIGMDASEVTLQTVIEDYFTYKATFTKESTIINAKTSLKNFLTPAIPLEILLPKITTRAVQLAVNERIKQGYYDAAKRGFMELKRTLAYAQRMELIKDISFMDRVTIPKKPHSIDDINKARAKYLDENELEDVLARLEREHPMLALVFEFQALTGLRFGEMMALRTEDYDRKNQSIHVNGTLQWRGKASDPTNRWTPKNVHFYRDVTLPPRAVEIIEHFIIVNKARKMWKPTATQTNYIFVTDGGLPFNIQFANKILKRINYHKPISTHTFRHTHISILASANVPIKAIMERVGHNEPRTTLAVYTHVTEEMQKAVQRALATKKKTL